jgi:hypothetical protein
MPDSLLRIAVAGKNGGACSRVSDIDLIEVIPISELEVIPGLNDPSLFSHNKSPCCPVARL